jgi:YhcH/YjgK/YiaL family protein
MIFGEIAHPKQAGIDLSHPVWRKCWEWLGGYQPDKDPGIEKFDGDRFYANLHEYETKPAADCVWEAHKYTIDLQVVLDGGEFVEHSPELDLVPQGEYDPEKERWLWKPRESSSRLHLTAGRFAVFFRKNLIDRKFQMG